MRPYVSTEANTEHVMFFFEDRPDARARGAFTGVYDACGRQNLNYSRWQKAAQDDQTLALDVAVDHHFAIAVDCAGATHGVSYHTSLKGIDLFGTHFDDFDRVLKVKSTDNQEKYVGFLIRTLPDEVLDEIIAARQKAEQVADEIYQAGFSSLFSPLLAVHWRQ